MRARPSWWWLWLLKTWSARTENRQLTWSLRRRPKATDHVGVFFASGRCTLDLRTQYEMGWRDSGTHSADETGTPSRCARISHRQPSGQSRSFAGLHASSIRRGHHRVRARPLAGCRPVLPLSRRILMRIARSKSAPQGLLPHRRNLQNKTRRVATKAAALRVRRCFA